MENRKGFIIGIAAANRTDSRIIKGVSLGLLSLPIKPREQALVWLSLPPVCFSREAVLAAVRRPKALSLGCMWFRAMSSDGKRSVMGRSDHAHGVVSTPVDVLFKNNVVDPAF